MRKKIFTFTVIIISAVLLLSFGIITDVLYNHFTAVSTNQLKDELTLASWGVELSGTNYLKSLNENNYRLTLISNDGTVIYDTKSNETEMDNHLDREEIKEAFETGAGSASRHSDTLGEKTLYEAKRLKDGSVLRISVSRADVWVILVGMIYPITVIFVISVIVAFLLANRMSKSIVKPLLNLDLEHPTDNNTYEELSPILNEIRRQHIQIKEQMTKLSRQNDEFGQIISSMSEGLILLNEQGSIIAINRSARKIFGEKEDAVGTDFLTLDRSPELSHAISETKTDAHCETVLNKNGREYQFNISRIEADGKTIGTLILGFDITEKAFAERNRQEFTANVSHELKTPLQSIIGSAELLENGLVKPEDTARFIGNIKNEATRLVSLINDIIRLSQLDEKSFPTKEKVELKAIANEVIEVLNPSAKKKNVTLSLDCDNIQLCGVRRYIYEIIYNLCDNAVRYNKDGGKVYISVKKIGENAVISVSDTGIGIPSEHQARIFERFYRVDKSHSKETGGTGLGLSIVKRAVMLHGGRVELNSTVNEGTTVKVILPEYGK